MRDATSSPARAQRAKRASTSKGEAARRSRAGRGPLISRCYDYSPVGGALRCYTATYDAVGNPVRMTDPEGVDVFVYDALDRLTEDKRYLPDGTTLVSDDVYTYNALGALKTNAGVVLDDQRPKLAGGGTADAAVPNTLNGQPVTLNAGGLVTSMNGASFTYTENGLVREAQDPIPALLEHYGIDPDMRRFSKQTSADAEFYYYEGMDRVAILDGVGALRESYLFDGVDHPLRIKQTSTGTTAYYELDLAGNVRHLFASGGADLGGYRYTAFGKSVEDTTTVTQPLRWKGRWFSSVAGGIYDVRARQWAPEMGVFLAIDGYEHFGPNQSLWAWPHQSPTKYLDPRGEQGVLAGAAGAAEAGATAYVIVSGGYCGLRWADCQYKESKNPQRPPMKEPGCPPKNDDVPPITITPTDQKPSCDACFLKCVGRFYLAFLKIDPWPAECNR